MSVGFEAAGPRPTQVLVVEDSATQALQIRHMLESRGFAVEAVASAEAALDRLNGQLPDLVIADYHLPGMNGDELSRQIRLNARTRGLPLLMLTEARDCRDVVTQIAAANKALEQVGFVMVAAGLTWCIEDPERSAAAGYELADVQKMFLKLA